VSEGDSLFDEVELDEDEARRWEIGREHRGLSIHDFLDPVAGPVDRKRLFAAARAGRLRLNGQPAAPGSALRVGDVLELQADPADLGRREAAELRLLPGEEGLIVAGKPSGLPFAEGRRPGRSVVEQLRRSHPGARPVHKLDKETSGLVIAAPDAGAEAALLAELRSGQARVEYFAIVRGTQREASGVMDVPLGKRRRSDVRLEPDPERGEACATEWRVAEALRGFLVLTLVPRGGGRSHQVRAHLAALGQPALCDALYGEDDRLLLSQLKLDYRGKRGRPERPLLDRPALHAARLMRGIRVAAEAPLPDDLAVLLAQLRRLRPLR